MCPSHLSMDRRPIPRPEPVPESYEPIDCSFHDRLESWATLRSTTTIRYLDRAGVEVEVRARIADLYTRDGVEYLQTRSEEHTAELQSRGHLVCRLLPE